MLRPVSIITVAYNTFFFVRLLVEKVREFIGARAYEIIVVDRGSRDGSREWLSAQPDVRVISHRQWRRSRHGHGEAAEKGARAARHEAVVLLDSDAHRTDAEWLARTADRLDERKRLAGAVFHGAHSGNPYGWYVHPHFMVFHKTDLGSRVVLRKLRGHETDTGEEATISMLKEGLEVLGYPLEFCARFDVGHPHFPTVSAGVFHAWYGTRTAQDSATVSEETAGAVSVASYLQPLQKLLRAAYTLPY